MRIVSVSVGDVLEMKKQHTCGSNRLKVLRVGSDLRVVCEGCGRDMTVPREKLERSIKKVHPGDAGRVSGTNGN